MVFFLEWWHTALLSSYISRTQLCIWLSTAHLQPDFRPNHFYGFILITRDAKLPFAWFNFWLHQREFWSHRCRESLPSEQPDFYGWSVSANQWDECIHIFAKTPFIKCAVFHQNPLFKFSFNNAREWKMVSWFQQVSLHGTHGHYVNIPCHFQHGATNLPNQNRQHSKNRISQFSPKSLCPLKFKPNTMEVYSIHIACHLGVPERRDHTSHHTVLLLPYCLLCTEKCCPLSPHVIDTKWLIQMTSGE